MATTSCENLEPGYSTFLMQYSCCLATPHTREPPASQPTPDSRMKIREPTHPTQLPFPSIKDSLVLSKLYSAMQRRDRSHFSPRFAFAGATDSHNDPIRTELSNYILIMTSPLDKKYLRTFLYYLPVLSVMFWICFASKHVVYLLR